MPATFKCQFLHASQLRACVRVCHGQNEAALEAEVASLWVRLNEQGAALSATQQAQLSAERNAAERESELLAQLDAVSLKLQARGACPPKALLCLAFRGALDVVRSATSTSSCRAEACASLASTLMLVRVYI